MVSRHRQMLTQSLLRLSSASRWLWRIVATFHVVAESRADTALLHQWGRGIAADRSGPGITAVCLPKWAR
jgi:hypothetical protein